MTEEQQKKETETSGEKCKSIPLEEIKKHKTSNSLWVVIHNKVYDVTKFLDEHPGGEEVMIEQGGGNASDAFEDVGHSSDARELMKEYYIGDIAEEDKFPEGTTSPVSFGNPSESTGGFLLNWVLPAAVGIGVAVLYRLYFSGNN